MKRAAAIVVAVIHAGVLLSAQPTPAARRVVDLGHPLQESDPSWSGEKVYTHTKTAEGGIQSGRFATDEHFGTHLDAPVHFAASGWTVDKIPSDRLVRPAVCINVADRIGKNDDYRVTVADIQAWEKKHGAIPEAAIVFIATGWDARWSQPGKYMNVRDGVKHFPGLAVDAATYLARDRKVAGIGIDTPSVDYGPSQKYEVHLTTQAHNVYHIENATNLSMLPPTGATAIVAPVKIAGGSGGPTRVFALLP